MSPSNLYTPAEGIFDTHVTWSDIETDMQNALGTKATFGVEKTIKNIGDGNGFLSRICLIEPDWQGAENTDDLPKKFVAKLCTAVTMATFAAKMSEQKGIDNLFQGEMLNVMEKQVRTFHNCEVTVYELFKLYDMKKIPTAKIYHMHRFSEESPLKGYLLMEHVDDVASVHIFDNLRPETLDPAIRAIASMGAASLKFTDEERSKFTQKPLRDIFGAFFTPDIQGKMGELLRGFGGAQLVPLIERFEKEMEELSDLDYYDGICGRLGMTPILCHGDLWSTNVLWKKHENDYKILSVIDFQTAHFGNPAGDLCRLFNATMSGKDRRENWEKLVEKYYSYLEEELGESERPFTLEQLKDAYRMYMPIGGYMIVPMIGPFFEMLFKNTDEEERKKILAVVTDKTECLLEDMLECHEVNKTKRSKKDNE